MEMIHQGIELGRKALVFSAGGEDFCTGFPQKLKQVFALWLTVVI